MTADVGVDVDVLKREIKQTYAAVSDEPERDFIFPTGRAWAEDLDYPPELADVRELRWVVEILGPWPARREDEFLSGSSETAAYRVLDLALPHVHIDTNIRHS